MRYAWETGKGFIALRSDFKEEPKFTKQKSGSEFSVEGVMAAKAITLKEHGLLGGACWEMHLAAEARVRP